MADTNFLEYYDLERYLFEVVSASYAQNKSLTTFDFFCIVIWKANRAKSKVAKRLLAQGSSYTDLDSAVRSLLSAISEAKNHEARLSVLIKDWGFRLPMASAILTVLYPDDFTVYDVRVCNVLNNFLDAQYMIDFAVLWERYSAYVRAVRDAVPKIESLRDKDRYLWGTSFASQLQADIQASFRHENGDVELDA